MNKKIIPVIIILLLLGVLGVGIMMMTKNPVQPGTANLVPTGTQSNQTKTGQGTLKDLLTGGKAQKCTYTNSVDKATVTMTIYVANGKMRGDINSTSAETSIKSHMIVDSSYSYLWMDNTNQGFKFPVNEPAGVTPSQKNGSVDLNQNVNYTCENWNVDESLFQLPANITFQALAIPSLGPTGTSNGTADNCSICDNIPAGEARTACKTQFKCK